MNKTLMAHAARTDRALASGLMQLLYAFMERRYRTIVFAASMVAHIPFLFGRYLPRESLKYFSADENALIRVIERYQDHIATGHWWSLLTEKLEYGYGYLFFLPYSAATHPFALIGGDEAVLAAGRLISALFASATILLVCAIARRMGASVWATALMGVVMAFTPGLIVMHKPLSAEQLSNFLIVAAAWAAFAMPLMSLRRNLFLISALAAAAISVKFNAALQGVFFAVIVLVRIFEARSALLVSSAAFIEKTKVLLNDAVVMIAGLMTFFVWNLPIVLSRDSRTDYFDWLIVQAQSNQNSQRGKLNYQGVHEWWPKIDAYFGDNRLLALLLLAAVAAAALGLLLRQAKITLHAALIFVWIAIPASYVVLTVKKIWLWYLVLPGLFLFLGPVLLDVCGRKLRASGNTLSGVAASSIGVGLLVLHLAAALPDYAAFSSQRWRETERPDFIEMEAMRAMLTNEISNDLPKTSLIVDQQVTLPIDAWRAAGVRIDVKYLPDLTEELLSTKRPDFLVIRYWGYAHHRGNIKRALAQLNAKLNGSCQNHSVCFEELARFEKSRTIIFKNTKNDL